MSALYILVADRFDGAAEAESTAVRVEDRQPAALRVLFCHVPPHGREGAALLAQGTLVLVPVVWPFWSLLNVP